MGLFRVFAFVISEFLATALLVICTCLARCALDNSRVAMAVAYGLAHLAITNCFGQISGCFANPAVTVAFWWRGYMPLQRMIIFVGAEIGGAIVGHRMVHKILDRSPSEVFCNFTPPSEIPDVNVAGLELLQTFLLIISWCALWDYEGNLPMEWYLAGVNTLLFMIGGATTNPARTITPAVFSGKTDRIHISIAGQLAAAILAPSLWKSLK